jgi:hypothetical protein
MIETGLIKIAKVRKAKGCRKQFRKQMVDDREIERIQTKLLNPEIHLGLATYNVNFWGYDTNHDFFNITSDQLFLHEMKPSEHKYLQTHPKNLWIQGVFELNNSGSYNLRHSLKIFTDDKPVCPKRREKNESR